MRPILFHIIITLGAISNAIVLSTITANTWIIIGTTVVYVLLFELLYLYLKPRLIKAERMRNLRKYPLLKQLIDAKRAIVTLRSEEVLYNVSFEGYASNKTAKQIILFVHKPKQGKIAAKVEQREIEIAELTSLKVMK